MNRIRINKDKKLIVQNLIHRNYFKKLGSNVRLGGTGQFFNSSRIEIGDNVYIGRNFYMDAISDIVIGSGTMIGPKVTIIAGTHNYNSPDLRAIPYDKRIIDTPVYIGENVWIGANVSICPGAVIEDGAVIGMGTVVAGRVEKNAVVVSSKQITIKTRDAAQYEELKKQNQIYNLTCTGGNFEIVKKDELFGK